jgi:hypothetical protein
MLPERQSRTDAAQPTEMAYGLGKKIGFRGRCNEQVFAEVWKWDRLSGWSPQLRLFDPENDESSCARGLLTRL